jgi:hypothetical protein
LTAPYYECTVWFYEQETGKLYGDVTLVFTKNLHLMKKFIMLAVACLFFISAQAQVQQLTVINSSGCNVYFKAVGDVAGNGCNAAYVTGTTKQYGTGGIVNFDAGMLNMLCGTCTPGSLSMGDDIVALEIYDKDPGCGGTLIAVIGDPCYTGSTSTGTFTTYTIGCTPCGSISGTWTSTGPTSATVNF